MGGLCLLILFFTWICIANGYPPSEEFLEIKIRPSKSYCSFGENVTIRCKVSTHKFLAIHWYRDIDDDCASSSKWCHQEETTIDENEDYISVLQLFNMSSNHTYTCVSKTDDLVEMKASVGVRVGPKPEILKMTTIPEEPQARGRQVQVVCQFLSMVSPESHRIGEEGNYSLVDATPLTKLEDQKYQINVTLTPILKQRSFFCRVTNRFGRAERNITVHVDDRHLQEECINDKDCVTPTAICNGKSCQCPALLPVAINSTIPNRCLPVLEFGDRCLISEQCQAADSHTLCDVHKHRCLCIPEYAKSKDKCILTRPEGSLVVLLTVGSTLVLIICSMLGLYYYRKKKEEKQRLTNNNDSDTCMYEMETKKPNDNKTVQFELEAPS